MRDKKKHLHVCVLQNFFMMNIKIIEQSFILYL